MTWNYRIVKYQGNNGYGLHEVYYNDKAEPVTMGAAPASFCADLEEGVAGIVNSLKQALKDAEGREVLEEPKNWPGVR